MIHKLPNPLQNLIEMGIGTYPGVDGECLHHVDIIKDGCTLGHDDTHFQPGRYKGGTE
jgi:hypothetical protein